MKTAKTAIVILALLAAAGCIRSAPSTFYLLKSIDATAATQPAAGREMSLGVGPVEIPDYLRRTQIARLEAGNEVSFSDASRWAEPLDTGIQRVLSENLSILAGTRSIVLFPWLPSAAPDYQVRLRIVTFDGSADSVRLSAYWSVYGAGQKAELASRKSLIAERPASGSVAAMVQAQNRALEALSREIAAELRRVQGS